MELCSLAEAARQAGATKVVREWLSRGHPLPAFGHPLYADGDPRAIALLAQFQSRPVFAELRSVVESVTGELPNVDFAIAAMADAYDLPAEAPFTIFALARSVGWIAHILEQSATGNLIRPRARYVGPQLSA
jgi:citrate synthase